MVNDLFLLLPNVLANQSQVKKEQKDFFIGRVKRNGAPLVLSGKELYDVVLQYKGISFSFESGKQKFPVFNGTHNLVKRNVFF